MNGSAKVSLLICVAWWIMVLLALSTRAQANPIFGPKDYVRGTGAPKIISDNFTAQAGMQCTLKVKYQHASAEIKISLT